MKLWIQDVTVRSVQSYQTIYQTCHSYKVIPINDLVYIALKYSVSQFGWDSMVHDVLSPEVQLSDYTLLFYNLKVRLVCILIMRFHAYILSDPFWSMDLRLLMALTGFATLTGLLDASMAALWLSSASVALIGITLPSYASNIAQANVLKVEFYHKRRLFRIILVLLCRHFSIGRSSSGSLWLGLGLCSGGQECWTQTLCSVAVFADAHA